MGCRTLTPPTAARRASRPMPVVASRLGLVSMRTAGLAEPPVKRLADALDLGDLLREDGVGDVVHLRDGDRVRREREDQDGRVGRG